MMEVEHAAIAAAPACAVEAEQQAEHQAEPRLRAACAEPRARSLSLSKGINGKGGSPT